MGSKKLKGYKDSWRIRVGDWRVVYIVNDAAQLVSITRALIVGRSTNGDGKSAMWTRSCVRSELLRGFSPCILIDLWTLAKFRTAE